MTLLYISTAWVLGTYLGSRIPVPPILILLGVIPICLTPFWTAKRKHLLLSGFCLLTLLGGNYRFQINLPQINEHRLQFYNNKGIIEIYGVIHTEPERKGNNITFQLDATTVRIHGESKEVSGRAIIFSSSYHDYRYGDVLKIIGEPKTPPALDDFDYKSYLAQQNVYSLFYYPQIQVLERGKGFKLLSWIYSLRRCLSQNLYEALPAPQASLAQAILLGLRASIPQTLRDAFAHTGTAHLLAISGLHLSIIIGIVTSAAIRIFGRRYYIHAWFALLTIWLYTLVAAVRPPIVRGTIMGSLFLIAECLGRPHSAITALAFAAAVMTGVNPQVLWDASFQLSFLAMSGLVVLAPHFQTAGRKLIATVDETKATSSMINFIIDSSGTTLAAILATLPVVAYHFGIVSLVSFPATFFALLALPGIVITAGLVSVIGLTIPVLSQLVSWTAWIFLSYFIFVIRAYDAIPFNYSALPQLNLWHVVSYYTSLAASLTIIKHKKQITSTTKKLLSIIRTFNNRVTKLTTKNSLKWITICLLVGTTVLWTMILTMPDDKLHVSILDVGQGDAILIQTPNRQTILIDGGPNPETLNLRLGERIPFWRRTIDLIVLTQPQSDHLTGLIGVIPKYKTPNIMESGATCDTLAYQTWLKVIDKKAIKHEIIHTGQVIDLGNNIELEVLHPPPFELQNKFNNLDDKGVVLRLSWGRISFLFTADIGKEAEWYLIARQETLRSTVLKVSHHGSKTATSTEFLSVVDPEIAVISVAENNRFSQPHPEVLEKLTSCLGTDKVFLTSKNGTIEFITDGCRLWVKSDK